MRTATQEKQVAGIAQEIGQRLRQQRERQGLSQEALAREVGLSREVIRRAEAGVTIPEWGNLAKLAERLGLNLRGLVGMEQMSA